MEPAQEVLLSRLGDRGDTPVESRRLARARLVLGGKDDRGQPSHPSMFDPAVISFAHGEGVRRPHPQVVAAGVRALLDTSNSSLENYLFLQRLKPLDEAVSERFCRIGVPPGVARNVVIDSGTTKLFLAFLAVISRPGDVFLTSPGFYHPLAAWCQLHRVRLLCLPTSPRNAFRLTAEDLRQWWRAHVVAGRVKRPVGLFFFNPDMVGNVYTQDELEPLAEAILECDLLVLDDAIFAESEFHCTRKAGRIASLPGLEGRVFTISGASKLHGLANLRIAWGCGPEPLTKEIEAFTTVTSATIPQVAKLMALEALRAPAAYVERNRRECAERAALVSHLVDHLNAELRNIHHLPATWSAVTVAVDPQAGHSLLLSLEALRGLIVPGAGPIKDSIDLTRYFLRACSVAFSPGLSIGWEGCYLRCCFACVGTAYTFAGTRSQEAGAVCATLRDWWKGDPCGGLAIDGGDGSQELDACDDADAGFREGRNLIVEGLSHRVCGALDNLLRTNRDVRGAPLGSLCEPVTS